MQIRGVRPFFSDKYDLTKHPNYNQLADADAKNIFRIENYRDAPSFHLNADLNIDYYEISIL